MLQFDEIAKEVDPRFGDNAITDGPKTFLYFFRRFGFPKTGSDAEKSVCMYYIPSSQPGVWVSVIVDGVNAYWSLETSNRLNGQLSDSTVVATCQNALRELLTDLIRPVVVRDSFITVFGAATADDVRKGSVEYSHMAGWGVPTDAYADPEVFLDFMAWVKRQGHGDVVAGMKSIMPKGEEDDSDN